MDYLVLIGIVAMTMWVRSSYRRPSVALTKRGARYRAALPLRIVIWLGLILGLGLAVGGVFILPSFDGGLLLASGFLFLGLLGYLYPPEIIVGKRGVFVRRLELSELRKIPFGLIEFVTFDETKKELIFHCTPAEFGWRSRAGMMPGLGAIAELLRRKGIRVVQAG